jgi:hypothetical protein
MAPRKASKGKGSPDTAGDLPFETRELRDMLEKFLDTLFTDPETGKQRKVGSFKWGVYAFFDYDNEPIYVGQTKEKLSTRIRRHLTNQRTDAVAMSVLDPFEVYEIQVWPLPQFEKVSCKSKKAPEFVAAKAHLDALENLIHRQSQEKSKFGAVLNEKDPPVSTLEVKAPPFHRSPIVSPEVLKIRSHPDFRIARRALIIGRLAQVIAERKVQGGLRRTMRTQAKRILWLAEKRYLETGGDLSVERKTDEVTGDDTTD